MRQRYADARRGPIQGLNPVKPNIMFTMDDSGQHGMGFPAGLHRLRRVQASLTAATAQCGGATAAPGSGYVFSQYDPPVRSNAYNGVFYDPTLTYTPARKPTEPTCLARSTDTARGPPPDGPGLPTANGFAGHNPARHTGGADGRLSRAALPGHGLVLEVRADRGLKSDRRQRRLGVPAQRPPLRPGHGQRQHDAGNRGRLQLPEQYPQ